jgi:peptidyl-prolyl cis-trans isomerase SurA
MTMLLCGSMVYAQNNPIIMRVNGHPVTRSEFEYSYNNNNGGKADKKSIKAYVTAFVDYKLKVQAALDAKLDTISSLNWRNLLIKKNPQQSSYILNADAEKQALKMYENQRRYVVSHGGMRKLSHILLTVNQRASYTEENKVKEKIYSLYRAIKKGADFGEMAKKYSQDMMSAQHGGALPWMCKGTTFKEFEDVAWNLKKGEMSSPFQSPAGYHIILMNDACDFLPFDSVKSDLSEIIEYQNARERVMAEMQDRLPLDMKKNNEASHVNGIGSTTEETEKTKYLLKEYQEGILLTEMSNRIFRDRISKDGSQIEKFFLKHRKQYKWDSPRFKGVAFRCKSRKDERKLSKILKNTPYNKWGDKIRSLNHDSLYYADVRVGIFKMGDNSIVDHEFFKKNCQQVKNKQYPYEYVYGNKLKKYPETYQDVRDLVLADYQEEIEKEWVKQLRKLYSVKIYENVLSTVNNHE